ncbi:MAG: carboxypeptidase-like regulatory domain-containing protein [Marinilabiliaceae bacterium]|nr:carboxypeptidase-like regulatory domain-containing protein [Marinilabiliaceae bacterium]
MLRRRLGIRWIVLLICFCVLAQVSLGQALLFKGTVIDASTKEGIPMVNVYLKGTTIGTISDVNGSFKLSSPAKADTLVFSSIGYLEYKLEVTQLSNPINIELSPDNIALMEVEIKPDDGPVRALLEKMVANKKRNNPENHKSFHYEKYSKWEYLINNADSTLMEARPFRKHQSVFRTADDGSKYLPVYLSEQIVYNEFQRQPLRQKSTILADKTSGLGVLGDYEIGGYTSGLDIEYNFYDNFLKLFEENFVSPAASNGWFFYHYYIEDSAVVGGVTHYKILFTPRRKQDKVFRGHMVIEDKYFSLVEVTGELSTRSNMNFVKSLSLSSEFQLVNDSLSFFGTNVISAVFDYLPIDIPTKNDRMELDFTQQASYDKVIINPVTALELSAKSLSYESVKTDGFKDRDTTYWLKARHVPLTANDKELYATIDSVNTIPVVKLIDNFARMSMTGYYDFGSLEMGPYMHLLQFNKIEGMRLFMGGRTSKEISNRWMAWGGLGYATRTGKVSASVGGGYKLPGIRRRVFKLSYDDTYARMGENRKILYLYENMLTASENNLVSAFFTRDEFDELYRQQNMHLSYEHEWKTGLSTKLDVGQVQHHSPEFYPFLYQGNAVDKVTNYEAALDIRLSWREKILDDEFMRLYLATDYPILHFTVAAGRVSFAGQEENYTKLHATIKHIVHLGQTTFRYAVEGGAVFGKLPYTFLEIPRGNETYGYYTYDFNMINYLEFVHDRYVHAYTEYHLNGFFLNRIPLLRSLGFREVFSAKAMVGDLSDRQYESIQLPASVTSLDGKPYVEVGAGIANILKVLRFDAVWRLTPDSKVGAPNFGIRAKFELSL